MARRRTSYRRHEHHASVKSTAQQDLQSLHRVRSQLIQSRTALANEIRSLLAEYGITIAKELRVLRRALPFILEDQDNGLSGVFRETLAEMMERLRFLDERIRTYEQRVKRLFDQDERYQRLADIQGVGPLIATALVAAVGNAREFRNGRELSAWLGLVRASSPAAVVAFCWALLSEAISISACC